MTPTPPASLFTRATPASRRSFLRAAGGGAVGLVALAACGGGGSGSSTGSGSAAAPAASSSSVAAGAYGEISLQLSWIKNIEFAGEYFADSKGYYKDAGFTKVDLVSGPVDSADALVAAGTIDVGCSSPDSTARYIVEQGAPLKVIASTFQKNPFCILSIEEGKPIRTMQDLAGKTIGIQAGTNQAIFAGLCKANKIDPSTFKTTVVQFEPTPLTEKKVDGFMAFLTNEPFLVRADGFTPVTLSFADNGLPMTSETFCVTQEMIDSDRDKLKAFLKAEIQGWNDAVADPEGSAKLAVDTYGKGLKLELASQTEQMKAQNKLVVSADTKKNGLFTMTDELVAESIKAIAAVGVTITAEQLFDLSLVNEVYRENPDLIKS
ncbi:MAG TPA: ABC transporter substrate-binding protein [Propionibacteriaceae bacterium]|jgi:ABC-type nitrate/sulfonate/bicarbonate transport system substrate-binding protein